MSEDKTLLRALCDALSPFVPPEHDVLDAAEAVMAAIGIPAATLSDLRSGDMVAVPRELTEAILKAFREAEARAATSGKPVNSIREMNDDLCREAWPAMLAAAKDARHD